MKSPEIGKSIEILMKINGKTKTKVCEYLGCARTTLDNYLSGESSPTFDTLLKLSNYFGVSIPKMYELSYMDGLDSKELSKENLAIPANDETSFLKMQIEVLNVKIKSRDKEIEQLKEQLKNQMMMAEKFMEAMASSKGTVSKDDRIKEAG